MNFSVKEWHEQCPVCAGTWVGTSEMNALRNVLEHVRAAHAAEPGAGKRLTLPVSVGAQVHVAVLDWNGAIGNVQVRCLPGIVTGLYGERHGSSGPFTLPTEDERVIAVAFSGEPPGMLTKAGIPRDDGYTPESGDPGRLCGGRTFRPDTWHWGSA